MKTVDLRKQYKTFYSPTARAVTLVDLPALKYLMIDGALAPGAPPAESADFREAMQALYGAAYTLKFSFKKRPADPIDYPIMALEGLWWTGSGGFDAASGKPWQFTMLMMVPAFITRADLKNALAQLRAKRGDHSAFERLRLETFREGACMQIMHVGPYATEAETLARMKAFAKENGLTFRGKHHEIYLGDPRRAKPEKLKTVLRQPVKKAPGHRPVRRSDARGQARTGRPADAATPSTSAGRPPQGGRAR